MAIIFISHALADKPVIDDLFDLLQKGCSLRVPEIFCSSVEGAGIKTGEDFVKWVHANLVSSDLVILFLTPNYYASNFCIAEMGAAWAFKKTVFPLVIPDMKRDPGTVMLGRQTAIVNESGLDELRDSIAIISEPAPTARGSVKRDEFLKKFREKVIKLPQPPLVQRTLLKEESERTKEAMKLYSEQEQENERLKEYINALEQTKDAMDLAKVKAQFVPEIEKYQELVENVKNLLHNITWVENQCIFTTFIGEEWCIDPQSWREHNIDIEDALQSDWIIEGYDEHCYKANLNHPRMRPIFAAINELNEFINSELPAKEITLIEEEKGYLVDVKNRQYWFEALNW